MSEQLVEDRVEAQGGQRLWWWALRLGVVASGAVMLISLFDDFRGRWDPWVQGDWLINSINVPIRRGPTGSLIIHLADAIGVTPVTAVVLVQGVLVVILYAAYYRVVTTIPDPRLGLLLSVSPGLFLLMWPANLSHGALRKELIAMAVVALLLAYLRDRWVWTVVLAAALLTVGVWAHEVVILSVPVACYLLWLGARHGSRARAVMLGACAAAAVSSGVVAGLYDLRHTRVGNAARVCRAVTSRGVDQRICHGAIRWTMYRPQRFSRSLHIRDLNVDGLTNFAIMLLVSLVPLLYLAWRAEQRQVVVIAVIAAVPFLPLFAIVSDWGRWLSCCVFAFVAVVIAHALTGEFTLRRPPQAYMLVALCAVGLLVVPDHVNGIHWGGAVGYVPRLLSEFRGSLP